MKDPLGRKTSDEKAYESYRDRAYLFAFRNGFNKDYCSSRVKRFSKKEIADYENRLKASNE